MCWPAPGSNANARRSNCRRKNWPGATTDLTVVVHPLIVPRIAPDPDDDVVIGTALAARAEFVVTGDKSLQTVISYQGVRIVSTAEAMAMMVT